MVKLGFTGTQNGMTPMQRTGLIALLEEQAATLTEFHHGDCIGADAEAHDIVRMVLPKLSVHIHPPLKPGKRAWCAGDYEYNRVGYLNRNRDIVDAVDFLLACPKERSETLRSGTWATIRYARATNRLHRILFPGR